MATITPSEDVETWLMASPSLAPASFSLFARHREFEQREQLRTALASIGDAVLTTDALGNITGMNVVAETLTGWTRGEAVGQ